MIASLPLTLRRRVARLLAAVQRACHQRPVLRESVLAIRELTGVGTREAYRAAKGSDAIRTADALDWGALAHRSRAGILRDLARVRPEGADGIAEAGDDRTVVLAGIHAGSLPIAIAWLIQHRYPGWPILVLKSRQGDADERMASARWPALGVDIRFVVLEEDTTRTAVLRKARSRTLIVCMADMPKTYGRPHRGQLFWKRAWLASGAVELARICKGRLLLFSSEAGLSGDVLRFSGPYDAASTADAAQRLQAIVDSWISSQIIARPEQWHMWDRIDEFDLAYDA